MAPEPAQTVQSRLSPPRSCSETLRVNFFHKVCAEQGYNNRCVSLQQCHASGSDWSGRSING